MRIAVVAVLVVATAVTPVSAQRGRFSVASTASAAVTVPIVGTFNSNGEFTGTATINSFEQRGDSIVAKGFVTGTLQQGSRALGTVVTEVSWPVVLRVDGVIVAKGSAPAPARIVPARYALAQATCPVVQILLGATDVNVLGVDVALGAIAFDLVGDTAAPLGALVCEVVELLGQVAALVNLLNNILGLLTGLLGGLTGGIVPPVPTLP